MRSGAEWKTILMATVLLVPPTAALAQDQDDGPGRGVARISLVSGDVSVRRGDSGDWVAAAVNAPLVVEDSIAAGAGSRAEVQLDFANFLRLGANAEVRFTELENRRYQMQVMRGTVEYRVLRDSDADVDVSTPAASLRPSGRGAYRVTVLDNGEVEIISRAGDLEVYTSRGIERVNSGHSIMVRNGSAGPEFREVAAAPFDEFDQWNDQRDRRLERTTSYRYVSRSIYGADDLDGYGRWVNDPAYGSVWVPTVTADWAPYQSGRWVWEDWYGWTWVSYDPWGWAPYHYGRWYRGNWGWCWYPGPMASTYYWSPALVAFFGFGAGHGYAGFGFGNVGWVPLAPFERYYPWYGRSYYGGFHRYNMANVNVFNTYRNARVNGGVSGLQAANFGRGSGTIMRVPGSELGSAGVVRGQLPLAPSNESLRFANREPRGVPRGNTNTQFVSRRQATPVARVPFAQQQRGFQTAPSGTVGRGAGVPNPVNGQMRNAPQGLPRAAEPGRTAPAQGGAWRRFGEAQAGGAQAAPNRGTSRPATTSNSGAWQRFGEPGGASNGSPRSERPAQFQGASGAPQSMRIAPLVVRERSAPRMEPSPRTETAPRMQSAPRTQSAPRMPSGGGGGGARPSGGGGGQSGGRGGRSR
jgi:hypothetical protein